MSCNGNPIMNMTFNLPVSFSLIPFSQFLAGSGKFMGATIIRLAQPIYSDRNSSCNVRVLNYMHLQVGKHVIHLKSATIMTVRFKSTVNPRCLEVPSYIIENSRTLMARTFLEP